MELLYRFLTTGVHHVKPTNKKKQANALFHRHGIKLRQRNEKEMLSGLKSNKSEMDNEYYQ